MSPLDCCVSLPCPPLLQPRALSAAPYSTLDLPPQPPHSILDPSALASFQPHLQAPAHTPPTHTHLQSYISNLSQLQPSIYLQPRPGWLALSTSISAGSSVDTVFPPYSLRLFFLIPSLTIPLGSPSHLSPIPPFCTSSLPVPRRHPSPHPSLLQAILFSLAFCPLPPHPGQDLCGMWQSDDRLGSTLNHIFRKPTCYPIFPESPR